MDVVIHQFLLKLPQPTRRFHMFLHKSSNLGCQFHFRSHSYSMGAGQQGDIAVWTMALVYFILYTNIFYKESEKKNELLQHTMGPVATKPVFGVCKQQRHRPACACVQSDQHLCYSLIGNYHRYTCYKPNFNFLASLCG